MSLKKRTSGKNLTLIDGEGLMMDDKTLTIIFRVMWGMAGVSAGFLVFIIWGTSISEKIRNRKDEKEEAGNDMS